MSRMSPQVQIERLLSRLGSDTSLRGVVGATGWGDVPLRIPAAKGQAEGFHSRYIVHSAPVSTSMLHGVSPSMGTLIKRSAIKSECIPPTLGFKTLERTNSS